MVLNVEVSPAGKLARQLLALYIGNDRMEGLGGLENFSIKARGHRSTPLNRACVVPALAGWDHFDLVHRIR